jgi:hypothetical protein
MSTKISLDLCMDSILSDDQVQNLIKYMTDNLNQHATFTIHNIERSDTDGQERTELENTG